MRICTLWLDGYGRFSQRTIAFVPGFQVILGPNEQGKTTVRSFIGDMLYGQKRSATQRLYDETHTLRRPWHNPQRYGGRMLYRLDDGREFEVHRNFDRRNESVQVFDRTHARDISEEFPRLRNQELMFADLHLGVSKGVFLNVASIGHLDLTNLGDEDALTEIREQVLSLADSGDVTGSTEKALGRLEARIAAVGKPLSRSKPLPLVRQRLLELDQEREAVAAQLHEVAGLERRRHALLHELSALRAERAALEEELRVLDRRTRAERLRKAEELNARIEEVQKRCFTLSSVRDFPLDRAPEVQRAHHLVATARASLARVEAEQEDLTRQLRAEEERLGEGAVPPVEDVPEELEQELVQIEGKIVRCRERIEQAESSARVARELQDTALRELEALPDFSRMVPNPMEWLQQVPTSFRMECQARDEELAQLEEARSHVARLESELGKVRAVFSDIVDFNAEVRTYEVELRLHDEQMELYTRRSDALNNAHEEYLEEVPGQRNLTVFLLGLTALLVASAIYFENPGVYVAVAISGLGILWTVSRWRSAVMDARRAATERQETETAIANLRQSHERRLEAIERLLVQSGCATVRELEALYDRYRAGTARLEQLVQNLHEQERRAREKEHQVSSLFTRLQRVFRELGEDLVSESQIEDIGRRVEARYQAYRDAKHRYTTNRNLLAQHEREIQRQTMELEACQKREIDRSLEARRLLREAGYREESKHTAALTAVRSFRIRNAQLRQRQGRVEVLQERLANLTRQIEAERQDLARQEQLLERHLTGVGVDSLESWNRQGELARQYRQAREERTGLMEQLNTLLGGEDLEELRRSMEEDGAQVEPSGRSVAEVKAAIGMLTATLEERQQEAHDLHIAATERMAGLRSLNEVEEERAVLLRRREELQWELDAASAAAALIEEVARDRHTQIAPKLAGAAGAHLDEITGGAYTEVMLSRDLGLTVRIPETGDLEGHPERRLSKGTVDQIYLALRLALVGTLSGNGESIPMLLDDPFANYDDERLARATGLLARLGQRSQVLLFTCREDVARAAERASAPIVAL